MFDESTQGYWAVGWLHLLPECKISRLWKTLGDQSKEVVKSPSIPAFTLNAIAVGCT